jgi:PAS domain S-box-containing protein
MFFEKMMDGFAYHKIIVDKSGKPVDYVFLEVNSAFERMTGLKRENIVGKRVTEVLPGIEKDPADWVSRYGRVALTGEPAEFEDHAVPLGKWFKVSAYSPEKGHFAALFEEITQRKKAEDETARMASFPLLNPNPVVEVDFDCRVQYANPAAKAKFGEALLSSCHPMFADWKQVILTLQSSPTHTFSREITIGNNTFYQSLNLVPNSDRVRFYAVNIDSLKQAQNALRESEQRWATTVSSIGDAVITTDLNGNVTFLNNVAQNLTCWQGADALGEPLREVFHIVNEQTRREVEGPVSRVLKEGTIVGLANHTILLRKDGSEVPIDDSGAPIKDKSGTVTGVVLIFRDITERKKAEEKIAEQAFMIANANDAIIGYNSKQEVTFWNKAAEQLYGYSAEGALGKVGADLLKPMYTSVSREELLAKLAAVGHVEMESVRKTKDGRSLNIEAHVILLRNEAGKSIGYVSVDRDITERKRAELALRESEVKFRTVADFTYDWEYWIAPEGNFFYVSPSCERITGYTAAEFFKDPRLLTRIVHPEDKAIVGSHFDLVSSDELHDVNFRIVTRNGETRWISHACQKVFDANGTWSGRRASNRDITERKKAEEELVASEKRYHSLFSNMIDGFAFCRMIFDEENKPVDFVYLEINDAFERITGLKREAVVGKQVTKAIPGIEKANPELFEIYGRVALSCQEEKFEIFFKPLGMWLSVSVYCPVKGYFAATFEDITVRKKAEDVILKAKAQTELARKRLETILETTPSAVVIVEASDGKFSFANKRAMQLYGFDTLGLGLDENVAKVKAKRADGTDYPIEEMPVTRSLKFGQEVHNEEMIIERPDGKAFPIMASAAPLRDMQGSITAAIVVFEDITERKKAEAELQATYNRFYSSLSGMHGAVLLVSAEGRVEFANQSFCDYFNLKESPADLKGLYSPEMIQKIKKAYLHSELEVARIGEIVAAGKVVVSEEVKMADGRTCLRDFIPLKDIGKSSSRLWYHMDITAQKNAENALKKLNDELEERVEQRTAQVSAERQRLYNVLETLPAYVILLDKDHHVPFANKIFRERFGESHGRRCYEYLFNRDSQCDNCETYKVYDTNQPHHWEWTGPDGRDYDIYDYPFKEADGSTMILEMGIDITERKRAENQVRAASLYTRSLIEASLDPLVTISAEGKITDVNKAAEDATGCTRGELIGSDFSEYFTDPLKAREGYTKVFTEGFVVDYPLALKSKSGKIIDVLYNASVYRNEKGRVQGVFAAARDITQRKLAEAELNKHREHLEDLVKERTAELWKAKNDWERTFDSVPDLITLLDNNHRIIRVNQAMAKALGLTPQKCVGLKCYEHVHGTKCPPDFCPHAKTVQDGKEHVEEVHEPRIGGDFLVSTTPLLNEEGKMVGSVHVARNITDRKQMQRKLEEYAAHLEELVQERTQQLKDAERLSAIGETAGMVGHDLRNPLQTVTGETFLAKNELKNIPESDAKRNLEESVSIIGEQIGYMDKIVSDLQDFVRPVNPEKKPVNFQKLLMATLTQVTVPENIEVQTRIETDLPEVSADGQLLKRVFFNLFTNAVQAMPEGGKLTVRARSRKLGKENPKVVIDVEDTGEGIPENIRTKIFRPLFTTKSKGQGFGLAVCRRVVEAHGGTITFESKKGKGTRFIVELPA